MEDDRQKAREVGGRGGDGDARLEPRNRFVGEMSEESFLAIQLERQENFGFLLFHEEAKALRHHADHFARLAVNRDVSADDGGIGAEFAGPVAVVEDRGERATGGIVRAGEEAAEHGRNAENREGTVGDVDSGNLFGLRETRDADRIAVVEADILKSLVLLAINKIRRGRRGEVGQALDADAGSGV